MFYSVAVQLSRRPIHPLRRRRFMAEKSGNSFSSTKQHKDQATSSVERIAIVVVYRPFFVEITGQFVVCQHNPGLKAHVP